MKGKLALYTVIPDLVANRVASLYLRTGGSAGGLVQRNGRNVHPVRMPSLRDASARGGSGMQTPGHSWKISSANQRGYPYLTCVKF